MVLEQAVTQPFLVWFLTALLSWLVVVGGLVAAALVLGWLVAAIRHGPVAALRRVGRVLADTTVDLLRISPRRVGALSWLAVREAIRRRVVVVFAVFIVVLLFAGWFLDPTSSHPARLYLSFVLTSTSYLVLLLALFLSAMSLPIDIKNKTLHTIVTKPVRPSEVVLGRIVGFAVVGTVLLAIMATISYVFVVRGLSHTHPLDDAKLELVEDASGDPSTLRQGVTGRVHGHRHKVTVDASEQGHVALEKGHWHDLVVEKAAGKTAGKTAYRLGRPKGMLLARVPVYGSLRFKDRAGKDAEKGINVGDEWTYRSFIEGQTLAAAVWTFEGITEARFPQGLPVEMTIEIFRTHKGRTEDPEKIPGIPGSLSVRNPTSGETVEAKIFTARDFATEVQHIPRELETADGKKLDLFEDLVADGKVEILLRCEQPAQYFGAAQADLYLRARDASFALNFLKGYVGIWLQMVLIIGIGVMFSTFLSGPVALIATLGALVGGIFRGFMADLARGQILGGGPFEAIIRLWTQQNVISDMEPGLQTTVAQRLDDVAEVGLYIASAILPAFGQYDFADYVAYGFNISGLTILESTLSATAYLLPLFVAAYLFLKTREVAK